MLLLSINQATGRIEIRQCPSEPGRAIRKNRATRVPGKRGEKETKGRKKKSRARENPAKAPKKNAGLVKARQKGQRKKPGS
jgi:hypothetical protein